MRPEDGYPEVNYPAGRMGKYQITYHGYTPWDDGRWMENGGPEYSANRKGLLYSDIPIFTIGLGIEHFDNIPHWDEVTTYERPNHLERNEYKVFVNPDDPNDHTAIEAATPEYNFWRIANTSGAEYFFAPDPDDLGDIFDTIGFLLTGPQNLTSLPGTGNTIMSTGDNELTQDVDIPNRDKWAVTPELDLRDTSEAWLTFMHKYRLIQGVNGAYIQVGYHDPGDARSDENDMMWRYIKPTVGPYTGNLLLQVDLPEDSFGNIIQWCWNGKSAAGTMQWEFVRVNLLRDEYQIPEDRLDTVRVRFYYKQYGGGLQPGGWLIDDVSVVVSREGNLPGNIGLDTHDVWHLQNNVIGRHGETSRAWWNANPRTGVFQKGIDNRLVTSSIDLTNARTANFTADFKFNINTASGTPPDGFRVEITTDGGRNWKAINVGIRTASGISGTVATYNWTTAGELKNLNVDLSDYSGNIVQLRFRVFTNANDAYAPYEEQNDHGGLYIDNVIVYGETN